MTPFRQKPVQWDGDDDNGRFENKGGYKYDIVNKTLVKKAERMPKYYLADTPEEADVLYNRFEKYLNDVSAAYVINTGLSKADLFGEGLIGLGRAYRDWDPSRSDVFTPYARFRIKDAMNEFVRENGSTVSVPTYVKKSHANVREIKNICEAATVDPDIIISDQELPDELETSDAVRCAELISNLINAANRAKVSYKEFLERISLVPEDTEYVDQTPPEVHQREIEMLEAAVVVEKLKDHMDEIELAICEGVMLDKTYEEIGKGFNRSKSWVSGKLKVLKTRIIEMMHDGKL